MKKMVWKNYNYDVGGTEKDLVWDLRQTYAQILDEVLKRIASVRVEKNYEGWFEALEHLHTEINQKLNPNERKEYSEIKAEIIKELNKYPQAYNGQDKNPQHILVIYSALKKLELWLKEMMEKHRMFGAKEDAELL